MGFQWLFFTDADVNNNPDYPIIRLSVLVAKIQQSVSEFVSAFIAGAHSDSNTGVLVTAKHFPGHGDTATDTHMNLAVITADQIRDSRSPGMGAFFSAAIAKSGVDSVMTAHIAVPALDDPALPATLSPKILTGVLRDDLNFKGLIVTDALDMGGISHGFTVGDASVRALEAGADVLLMPSDPKAAIDAVVAAVKTGRLTTQRIDDGPWPRILAAKARVGLGAGAQVDVNLITKVVNTPESNAAAQKIADRSVTLVRNQNGIVPLKDTADTVFYTMNEGAASVEGTAFYDEVHRRMPQAMFIHVSSAMSKSDIDAALQRGAGAGKYVIAAYASVAASHSVAASGGRRAA